MKIRYSNLVWGTFFLLVAAFLLVNQFNNFMEIGIGSIIVSFLSIAFIVQCIAHLSFAPLPIPVAVLYIIFQTPLGLPDIPVKTLILASVIASIGLAIILPRKNWFNKYKHKHYNKPENHFQQPCTENLSNDNNPSVKVNFGAVSRRLHADSLETAQLYCNFGALEVFFDNAVPCPNGAVVDINCSFGAVKLIIPKNWRIIDRLNCSLGGVDIDKNFSDLGENAPKITLTGSVSLGGIEVRHI